MCSVLSYVLLLYMFVIFCTLQWSRYCNNDDDDDDAGDNDNKLTSIV